MSGNIGRCEMGFAAKVAREVRKNAGIVIIANDRFGK